LTESRVGGNTIDGQIATYPFFLEKADNLAANSGAAFSFGHA